MGVVDALRSVAEAPSAADVGAVARALGTDLELGLSEAEAARRLAADGPNELVRHRRSSVWALAARQLTNTMTVVLVAAGVTTLLTGDRKDAAVIFVVLAANATIGLIQEHRAERAVAALEQLTATTATVIRGGCPRAVPAAAVARGDLVVLRAGVVAPADLRLVEVHGLRVDESALTGESEAAAKSVAALVGDSPSTLIDLRNMAFKGTAVTYGRATGIAVATGTATELGRIASLLETGRAEPTPLQRRLATLGRRLAEGALVVCAVVFATGVATGERAGDMFLRAVSLAVAAVPEGLPAVVTVSLAVGAHRMAARRALVRRLLAVETLGSVTVICTDKTGTLTQNRMLVERVWTPDGEHGVAGDGYCPDGEVSPLDPDAGDDPFLRRLGRVAAACNDARLHPPTVGGGPWTVTGDPTEGALLALASKLGIDRDELVSDRPRVIEVGFDASRRRMATGHSIEGGCWVAVKGSLAAIAPHLRPDQAGALSAAEEAAVGFADRGYRVLALAETTLDRLPDGDGELERDLELLGLVAMADPPRPGVIDAITAAGAAGITPVMITGDHPATATAIARRLGILTDDGDAVLTGEQLERLTDDELAGRVPNVRVYARTTPEQKLRIVDAWKAAGAIVAMTGDGINDAPALRHADIGVAMGASGTDVSREAADMVLADDNFATIVDAVREGRRIYDNIRRFVRYMLATNSGELWVMLLAPVLGLPFPLLPAQILWINLVTDGPPAVALGMEPGEPDGMRRPPRPPGETMLGAGLWQQALWVGLLMAASAITLEAVARAAGWPWQTMVFTTLSFLSLGNALAVRSERVSLFRLGFRSNRWMAAAVSASTVAQLAAVYAPGLREMFDATPLTALQLAVSMAMSTTLFVALELEKALLRARQP